MTKKHLLDTLKAKLDEKQTTRLSPAYTSSYKISFGKWNGLRIDEVNRHELRNYIEWLKHEASKTKSQLRTEIKAFIEVAEDYLKLYDIDQQMAEQNRRTMGRDD